MSAAAYISRRVDIDGLQLLILDGVFSDVDVRQFHGFVRHLPYRLNDVASDETEHVKHWKSDFPLALAENTPVLRECIGIARELLAPDDRFRLERTYTNMILHGDLEGPHVDARGGVTALYYANADWKEMWLGETVFYDRRREPVCAVGVKPGRLAIFHADLLHRAGVPSRECYEPRLTVAMTFAPR